MQPSQLCLLFPEEMVKVIPRSPILYYVYFAYMVIAVFGMVTNSIFLVVCISFKRLRTCCRLYMAIAFADAILAFAFLVTAFLLGYRRSAEMEVERGYVSYKSSSSCASEPNVALLTFGSLCPAFLTLYMGVDRFLSVKFPQMWNSLRS
uniref:G_PROTEIN_RECEP_F1_2 domain-containing protein n=1 Tax=Steinernema glaseri TaxID=37863 RepID=A0A1I7Z276_9BILA